jgi:hypothetical protein
MQLPVQSPGGIHTVCTGGNKLKDVVNESHHERAPNNNTIMLHVTSNTCELPYPLHVASSPSLTFFFYQRLCWIRIHLKQRYIP